MGFPPGVTPIQPQQQQPQGNVPPGVTPTQATQQPQQQQKVPPGVTPIQQPQQTSQADPPLQQQPQSKILPALGGILGPEVDAIQHFARVHGVPEGLLRTMGQLEVGGMQDPGNAMSPTGAQGPMQFLPDTFKQYEPGGNIHSITDSAEAAAKYMKALYNQFGDWRLAAAAFNAGPGTIHDWLYKGKPISGEAVRYMAYAAASMQPGEIPTPHDPSNKNNPPPGVTAVTPPGVQEVTPSHDVTERGPYQQHSNLDPTKAKKTWFDQLGGQADIPFILWGAKRMDDIQNPGRTTHFDDAMNIYMTNPAAAQDLYGLNAPNVMKVLGESGSAVEQAYAKFIQSNPARAAWTTFIEEQFNPMYWAEGKGMGVVGKAIGQNMMKHEFTRGVMTMASPFKGIVAKWGTNARNIIAKAGGVAQYGAEQVEDAYQAAFRNLTPAQKHDVIHMSQGNLPDSHKSMNPDMIKRAKGLRDWVDQQDQKALADGALTPGQVYKNKNQVHPLLKKALGADQVSVYFPMHGAAKHPEMDSETEDLIGNMGGKTSEFKSPYKDRKFPTLRDFKNDAKLGVKEGWDPAEGFRQHYTAQAGNRALVQMFKDLEKKHPGMVRTLPENYWDLVKEGVAKGTGPEGVDLPRAHTLEGRDLGEFVRLPKFLGDTKNPTLTNLMVAPEFGEWIEHGKGLMKGHSTGKQTGWSTFNNVMRFNIMYNPQYHPFWNIVRNYSAGTGANVARWMGNYTKVIAHQLGIVSGIEKLAPHLGPVLEQHIHSAAQQMASDIADSAAEGAKASFGMGSSLLRTGAAATVRTQPWEGAYWKKQLFNPKTYFDPKKREMAAQQWDKALTSYADWNRKMTFDRHGEAAFAARLYQKFTGRGMAPEDAAWATREILGNYQNVDPDSMISKMMFFYPWLKSNLPFWLKTFFTKPYYIGGPTTAFERQRQYAGDPNVENPEFAEASEKAYLGQDKGENLEWAPFDPANMLDHFMRGMGEAHPGGSLRTGFQEGASLVTGRMNPAASEVYDTLSTMAEHAGAEPGDYRGYEVMWNTEAPFGTSLHQWLDTTMGKMLPIPFPYLTRQMVRDQFHWDRMPQYIAELASAGAFTYSKSEELSQQVRRAQRTRDNTIGKLMARQYKSPNPMSQDELTKHIQQATDIFDKQMKQIQQRVENASGANIDAANARADAQQAQSVPPGVTPNAPAQAALPPGVTPIK
jgi:hypothetical protein